MAEAWVARVFGGESEAGNPTGVVRVAERVDSDRAQALASKLGFPDTVFFWSVDATAGRFGARFYSPFEELSVCYQALIAAAYVAREPRASFELSERALAVEWNGDAGWIETPRAVIASGGDVTIPGGTTARVIDTGRRRAFATLERGAFEGFELSPELALAWLRAQALSGLCLVYEAAADEVWLRVFTSSLLGREDVATGGAAAALPALLGRNGTTQFRVRQGIGAPQRRGLLAVRADAGAVWVGGHCEVLVRGELAAPL